jgi:hypothetical protein
MPPFTSMTAAPGLASRLALEVPDWCTATLVVRDERGELVGYGTVERTHVGAEVSVTAGVPFSPLPAHA